MGIGRLIDWWRRGREPHAIPDELWRETLERLPFLSLLTDDERARLRELTETFLSEKEFTAVGGLELTDAMCVSIAVQGCLPVLNLGLDYYNDWVGVVVYPDEFVIPRTVEDEFGVVHEYDDIASGEAWEGGPLIISWHDVQMAGDGYNVVIHEFAHKLDMRNVEANGVPPLPAEISRAEWEQSLLAAYDDFCVRVDAAEEDAVRHGETHAELTLPIDPYASENPGEFFAVLSETFFESPDVLARDYPQLFHLFTRFYRQDPLARHHSSNAPHPSPQ